MIHTFTGKTSLVIQYQMCPAQLFQKIAYEGPFMEVCMDNVGPESQCDQGSPEKKQQIQIKLVPGGPGIEFVIPRDSGDTGNRDTGHVSSDMIGDYSNIES